jgi:hypothetical protein
MNRRRSSCCRSRSSAHCHHTMTACCRFRMSPRWNLHRGRQIAGCCHRSPRSPGCQSCPFGSWSHPRCPVAVSTCLWAGLTRRLHTLLRFILEYSDAASLAISFALSKKDMMYDFSFVFVMCEMRERAIGIGSGIESEKRGIESDEDEIQRRGGDITQLDIHHAPSHPPLPKRKAYDIAIHHTMSSTKAKTLPAVKGNLGHTRPIP